MSTEYLGCCNICNCSSKKDVSILVPGAGLARLMFDIAKLGKMENKILFYLLVHDIVMIMVNREVKQLRLRRAKEIKD